MKSALAALSAAVILWTSSPAHAQTVTGTILGVVSDAGGGVISQAQVVITEENTGRKRQLSTDNLGGYLATFLPRRNIHGND